MPGKIKVKVLAGRNLPVMDRSGDTTDAYVELKFGNVTYKTDVCRKSLNPQWNSEWYKFEVDDAELQDEPLQIRLMDHDTYSANDAIGKVYINLNPLLLPGITPLIKNVWTLEAALNSSAGSQGSVMTGWLPVYDTMHGIRGEVNIIVKVELFLDFNKFRQSSCGVQFFYWGIFSAILLIGSAKDIHSDKTSVLATILAKKQYSPNIPHGYHAQVIHGFVEELIVSDDPEYKWIDKIRTPRASNEARQTLFFKLSGEVQRKIGLKALDLGGNAVIGYLQNFDLEGESGIVARGIGTAVTLVKVHDVFNSPSDNIPLEEHQEEASFSPSYPLPTVPSSTTTKTLHSPATKTHNIIPLHRRSSDSDLSITPKGNSLAGSDRSMGGFMKTSTAVVRTMNQDALEMLEYPFITMQQYPPGFVVHIGGLVSSRSVKLLERISNLEEPEGRDAWWTEIRMEVRSHARALACNVVIGYKEETSICDDVCVLNASGTAAVINLHSSNQDQDNIFVSRLQQGLLTASMESDRDKPCQKSSVNKTERCDIDTSNHTTNLSGRNKCTSESNDHESYMQSHGCNLCHLPYSGNNIQFKVNMSKCAICKRAKVPDVMFTTIELPENIPMTGRGCFIQATVCKSKKDLRGELNAKEISDCLPFLEYELYCLLLNKLKMKGMNAVFGLKLQVSIGERLVIGMAVGTAVFLTALPNPSIPQIAAHNSWHNEEQLVEIQKILSETVKKNIEFYQLKPIGGDNETGRIVTTSDTDDSDEDLPELDVALGSRDACILEVDDLEDMDRISLLIDDRPPDDFHVVNTQTIPGLEDLEIVRNLQMFTQVSRAKIPAGQLASMPSKYFAGLLQTVFFKLRRMVPCALCDMQFKVALPEQDEIQLSVVGMALGLGEPVKSNKFKRKLLIHQLSKDEVKKSDEHEMIFNLEDDHIEAPVVSDNTLNTRTANSSTLTVLSGRKSRPRSPLRSKIHTTHRHKHVPLKERYGVDITPLSYLPGGRIERYLGNLNFFFIRESTSVRENGGLSGFTHSFVMEILAIVRAHITALGGNAMVAFFMTQCVLLHNLHKNQGQCLINVGGDVVFVSYFANEKRSGTSNY